MFTILMFEQRWSIILQCMQRCVYSRDPQREEHFPYACKSTPVQHCGFIWNLPSTCVPVIEEAMYLTRDVAGEASAHTRCSHFSAFHIPYSLRNTHRVPQAEKPTVTHAHVTRCCYVLVDAGGLSVTHSLPPAEQAWLSLSFTTRLIDLLIIFFPGDPPVGDQRPPLYSFLLCSVLCWIDEAWSVNWPKN